MAAPTDPAGDAGQVRRLLELGYRGPFSFGLAEDRTPAPDDIHPLLQESLHHLQTHLAVAEGCAA